MVKRWTTICLAAILVVGLLFSTAAGVHEAESDASIHSLLKEFPLEHISYSYIDNETSRSSSVYFSPALLLQDARVLSGELAKASVALATAAYEREYVNDLLSEMGFTAYDNFSVYDRSENRLTLDDNDYVAYTIAYRDVTIFEEKYRIYCVPIQGTTGNAEWFSNFNLGKGTEHEGFRKASLEVYNALLSYFSSEDVEASIDKDHRVVWLTGHSRGAACANLIAGWLSRSGETYTTAEHVFGYTYACPAVSLNADKTLTNIYNFNNAGDMITMLPMAEWGYQRYGEDVVLDTSPVQLKNVKQQFETATGSTYAGEASDTNYHTLLCNVVGTDRDVYYNSPTLQAVLAFAGYALGGQNDAELPEVLDKYLDIPAVLWEVGSLTLEGAMSLLTGTYDSNDALALWAYQAYNETLEMTEEEFQAYLSYNAAMVAELEAASEIQIVDAQSFLTANNALAMANRSIRSAAECIEAAMMLVTDEDGNVMDKITHGHTQSTYTVWINSMYYGDMGWYNNDEIQSAHIKTGTLSVGRECFYSCNGLEELVIPDTALTLGTHAFANCTGLRTVTLPVDYDITTKPFGSGAYSSYSNGVTTIHYTCGQTGVMMDRTTHYTLETISGESIQSIDFEEGISHIGDYLFYYGSSSLETVTLPTTLKTIGKRAFESCHRLTAIKIPESVTSIGDRAFYNCSGLTSVELPDGLTSIGEYAFCWCNNLTSVELPESLISTGDYTFNGCSSLTTIELPESLTSIGKSAFNGCSSLTTIEFPESLTSIGADAFYDCNSLTTIELPDGLTSISESAFGSCDSLQSVEFPESLISIGVSAFYDCNSLTTIELPDGLTSISERTFESCDSLQSVEFSESLISIGAGAFGYCSLHSVELPESLISIGESAFQQCSLTSVELPESLVSLGTSAFEYCLSLESVELPESLISIGENAFEYCLSLTSITFEGDPPAIGDQAFKNVTATAYYPVFRDIWTEDVMQNYGGNLTWVAYGDPSIACGNNLYWTLDENGLLTISGSGDMWDYTVEENAPWNGYPEKIKQIVLESGVTSIGSYAFSGCSDLASVVIPVSVTRIGIDAFSGCSSLTSIEIPTGVTSIGECAFNDCSNLTTVELPESLTSIEARVFDNCSSLTSIEIPAGVTSIGLSAFFGCSSLAAVEIPAGLTTIGEYAFFVCGSLTTIKLPESLISVGNYAFAFCTGLSSITFAGGAPSIGDDAFQYVTATCYYLAGNDTWTEDVKQNYGGTLTWVATGGNEEKPGEDESDCAVSDNFGNTTHYANLNEALKAAAALENGGTVTLMTDMTVEGVVVPNGVTLDLGDATLIADYIVGLNGGTLTATPNSGKLIVDKGSLILPEEGYKNASGQYILPIWDPEQNCYLFSLFVVNTNNAERGLFIDEESETIRFQFKHQATGDINKGLLSDGSSDNAIKVIVRLVWESENGEAYQDFVYNDNFVRKVAVGEDGVSYDYSFTLSGYSAMNIKLDTLKVVGMIITDSGAVASGTVWTAEMAK